MEDESTELKSSPRRHLIGQVLDVFSWKQGNLFIAQWYAFAFVMTVLASVQFLSHVWTAVNVKDFDSRSILQDFRATLPGLQFYHQIWRKAVFEGAISVLSEEEFHSNVVLSAPIIPTAVFLYNVEACGAIEACKNWVPGSILTGQLSPNNAAWTAANVTQCICSNAEYAVHGAWLNVHPEVRLVSVSTTIERLATFEYMPASNLAQVGSLGLGLYVTDPISDSEYNSMTRPALLMHVMKTMSIEGMLQDGNVIPSTSVAIDWSTATSTSTSIVSFFTSAKASMPTLFPTNFANAHFRLLENETDTFNPDTLTNGGGIKVGGKRVSLDVRFASQTNVVKFSQLTGNALWFHPSPCPDTASHFFDLTGISTYKLPLWLYDQNKTSYVNLTVMDVDYRISAYEVFESAGESVVRVKALTKLIIKAGPILLRSSDHVWGPSLAQEGIEGFYEETLFTGSIETMDEALSSLAGRSTSLEVIFRDIHHPGLADFPAFTSDSNLDTLYGVIFAFMLTIFLFLLPCALFTISSSVEQNAGRPPLFWRGTLQYRGW